MKNHMLKTWLLIAYLFSGTGGQLLAGSGGADFHPENDPEWIRLNLKYPDDLSCRLPRDREIAFLRNLHFGLTTVFKPWFEDGNLDSSTSTDSLTAILKRQHAATIYGNDGVPYLGYSGPINGYRFVTLEFIQPGLFYYELDALSQEDPTVIFLLIGIEAVIPRHEQSKRLQSLRKRYHRTPNSVLPFKGSCESLQNVRKGSHTGICTDPIHYISDFYDVVRLPGVTLSHEITNEGIGNVVRHSYPPQNEVPLMLNRMEVLMASVKHLYHEHYLRDRAAFTANAALNAQLIELLEQYLYLGIHTHMFRLCNYSLVLSQVNFVLGCFGYRGVGPANLDYVGIFEQFEDFQSAFRRHLSHANDSKVVPTPPPGLTPPPQLTFTLTVPNLEDAPDRRVFPEGRTVGFKARAPIEGLVVSSFMSQDIDVQMQMINAGDSENWVTVDVASRIPIPSGGAECFALKVTPRSDRVNLGDIKYAIYDGDKIIAQARNGALCCHPVSGAKIASFVVNW